MNLTQIYQKSYRDQLILDHLCDVKRIAGRLLVGLPNSVDQENLEAAGILGLVEAAHQYDSSRGTEFSSFAYHRIRGAMLDELRRNCPLPQHVLKRWATIREVMSNLDQSTSLEKIAFHCELTLEQVEETLNAIQLTRPKEWNDEMLPVYVSEDTTVDEVDQSEKLADAIEQLDNRRRAVISMYYHEQLTLKEIGEVIDLSESRVSRLLNQARLDLRMILKRNR